MRRMALIFWLNLFYLVYLAGGGCAFAMEPVTDKDTASGYLFSDSSRGEKEAQSALETYGEKADSFQVAVSQSLSSSADWLDSFFREDRMEIEENKTSLRLAFSSYFEEHNTVDLGIRARFKFILPGFEEKLHLFLTSDLDEAAVDPLALKGVVDKGDEQNLNLSLRYFFRNARKRNFSFRVGMRFNDLTPVFYGGPRYSLYIKMDPWMFRFTEKVSCYSDFGWRSRSDFAFERYLADRFFFRTNFSGTWFQSDHGFFYSMNNSLYQTVDEDRAFVYEINTNFQTYPCNELSSLVMGIKCRTRIWREWLFFEVTPQISFQNQYDFDPVTGITFAIEGIFGKDALISAKP